MNDTQVPPRPHGCLWEIMAFIGMFLAGWLMTAADRLDEISAAWKRTSV